MRRIVLSHSRLQQYLACPSKYRFSNLYGQRRRDQFTAFAPDVGTALHKGMQHYMEHKNYNAAVWEMGLAFPWPLYFDPEAGEDKGRSFPAVLASFDKWLESNPLMEYELVAVNGRPAVELTIYIELGTIGDLVFVYELHMDMLVRALASDAIFPVDIKTYAPGWGDKDKPIEKYEFSTQLIGYMLGSQMLQELSWAGQSLVSEYWFLRVDLREPGFHTREVIKDDQQFAIWMGNVRSCCEMIAKQLADDRWIRSESHCRAWNQTCPHLSMCWQQQPEAEIADWYAATVGPLAMRDQEVPDFTFRMEILG